MDFDSFISDGYLSAGEIIDKESCRKLYKQIELSRDWSVNLFRSEAEVKAKLTPDPSPENPKGGTNPGKGKMNFSEKLDLRFIEENKKFRDITDKICGEDYEILLKKFIVAVPLDWVPEWLQNKMKKNYFDNLNPYIKEEFRDVTYFRGIDYHMDIMDTLNVRPDIITIYVYLNDVTDKMSPLHVIKKSHEYHYTSFPHYYENDSETSIILGENKDNKKRFDKAVLIGKAGSVYAWSSLIMHGTQPFKSSDLPRASLRYTIKKNNKSKKNYIIDEYLKKHSLEEFRNIKNNSNIIKKTDKYKKISGEFNQ